MLDDFQPIVHRLDGRTIRVWAVADVHIGAREADIVGFKRFINGLGDDDYIVLVGDLVNNGIKDSLTNVYEEVLPPSAQVDKAVELLEPVKDRILGAVSGNHENRTTKAVDIDITHTIMCLLGHPELYRRNMAFIRVNLVKGTTKDHYALMLTHGKSEARRRKFHYAVEGVDAIITAHTHNPLAEKPARIVFTKSNRVRVEPLVSMVATSWLSYGGYGAAGMYTPTATSNPQHLVLEYTKSNDRPGRITVVW